VDNATFNQMGAKAFLKRYPVLNVGAGTGYVAQIKDVVQKTYTRDVYGDAVEGKPSPKIGEVTVTANDLPSPDKLRRIAGDHRVSYMNIEQDTGILATQSNVTTPNSGAPVKISIYDTNPGGRIPCFYLPYAQDHNYRVTLVNKQNIANVNFFLTDIVNGCSVYVEGTPSAPTVYHLNAYSTLPTNKKGVEVSRMPKYADDKKLFNAGWDLKWQSMDVRFKTDTVLDGRVKRPSRVELNDPTLRPANKLQGPDYQIWPGPPTKAFESSLHWFQTATRAPNTVNGTAVDEMELDGGTSGSQGFVFGLRDNGGNWRFYVQRNALVKYWHNAADHLGTGEKIRKTLSRDLPARQHVGTHWLLRGVQQFWPEAKTGQAV
jgi:hypothetical protein